jgi:hypothetical protein
MLSNLSSLFVMKFCEKREARELSFPHIHVQCTHESMKHHRINDSWFSPSHNLLSSTDRGWSILRNTIRTSLMWQTTQVKGWHLRPSPASCLLPCSWLMTHDSWFTQILSVWRKYVLSSESFDGNLFLPFYLTRRYVTHTILSNITITPLIFTILIFRWVDQGRNECEEQSGKEQEN